jgi:hypothetical protein
MKKRGSTSQVSSSLRTFLVCCLLTATIWLNSRWFLRPLKTCMSSFLLKKLIAINTKVYRQKKICRQKVIGITSSQIFLLWNTTTFVIHWSSKSYCKYLKLRARSMLRMSNYWTCRMHLWILKKNLSNLGWLRVWMSSLIANKHFSKYSHLTQTLPQM